VGFSVTTTGAGTYFTALEGGLRAPFVISWPRKIPAGQRSNEIVEFSTQQPLSTVPTVVDLITDPREERNVVEPYNTWCSIRG
jgi:arylsulfatase A-like enzyme